MLLITIIVLFSMTKIIMIIETLMSPVLDLLVDESLLYQVLKFSNNILDALTSPPICKHHCCTIAHHHLSANMGFLIP
jgi:hypothetical protein